MPFTPRNGKYIVVWQYVSRETDASDFFSFPDQSDAVIGLAVATGVLGAIAIAAIIAYLFKKTPPQIQYVETTVYKVK